MQPWWSNSTKWWRSRKNVLIFSAMNIGMALHQLEHLDRPLYVAKSIDLWKKVHQKFEWVNRSSLHVKSLLYDSLPGWCEIGPSFVALASILPTISFEYNALNWSEKKSDANTYCWVQQYTQVLETNKHDSFCVRQFEKWNTIIFIIWFK